MEKVNDFASKLKTNLNFDENLVIKKGNRYFLLNQRLKDLIRKDFFYAGTYFGKVKDDVFYPSFNLLEMIAEKEANKIVIKEKAEWLFICGRDIFMQGIMKVMGSKKKGNYSLVLNRHGECLGFGRIVCDLDKENEGVAIRNISDVGDFLRRES